MLLQLRNIGIIKEANIKLNGLTVIAGENDTGKSTVGKILFAIIKSDNISWLQKANEDKAKEILAIRLNLVFDANVSDNGEVVLKDNGNKEIVRAYIKDKNYVSLFKRDTSSKQRFFDATFIASPLILDLVDFFNSVARMRDRKKIDFGLEFNIKYPYILWDLYDKLVSEYSFPAIRIQRDIQASIENIIVGEFIVERDKVYYVKSLGKKVIKVEMLNTAMGIKSFGIIQLLNKNRFLNRKNILIIDEPEVHLHPKWQLKFAQLIVQLVKKGVKILVNSHSPYMIEALKRYSEVYELESRTNFYLAKDGSIKQIQNSNSLTLSKIFEILSEPFDEFDKMDAQKLENG